MGFLDWLKPSPPLDTTTRALIEQAATAVEPLIKQVGGYERKLAPAVQHAIAYCEDIAARIPGPFGISRAAFVTDPLVHALFGSADAIDNMLATSQCVREHLPRMTVTAGQCCALLGMRLHEKSGFGSKLEGGTVQADVAQKTLYFSDHTLAEPSADVAAARQRLRDLLFDGLVKGIAAHVTDVRAEHAGLHQEQAIAQAKARAGLEDVQAAHTRRLDSLRERLTATADALQPKNLLDALITSLSVPEPFLRLDPVDITVDRAGIITSGGEDANTLHFAELTSRDLRRWVVILAHINSDDARHALERFETARHFIVI
jgi:hypothetical protein